MKPFKTNWIRRSTARGWFGLASLLVLMTSSAQAANELQDISFSALPGNRIDLVLQMRDPVDLPPHFTTDNPARIAVDLMDTASALTKQARAIGIGVARSITAIEAKDRTRVVINLVNPVPYDIRASGSEVRVSISGGTDAGTVSTTEQGIVSQYPDGVLVDEQFHIEGVDFTRGADGEGRVLIDLSSPEVVVDMRELGDSIELSFPDTRLPPDLAQTLDVTDFATPVTEILTRPDGENVRVTIKAKGNYDHIAYQADDLYTVEFRELTKQELQESRKKQLVYSGERLSLNFQDIEVRAVLQLLADFTGLNMVVSDTVAGRITLRLQNVPWDQALDIILKTKGLSKRQNDNVVLVAPTEEIAAREKLELESQQQIEELAPLRSEWIRLSYAKAKDFFTLLKESQVKDEDDTGAGFLSKRGSVIADERTNTLLIKDTAANLDGIRELVATLDIPIRQVLIESRIVIANQDFAKDIGVRLGFSGGPKTGAIANHDFLLVDGAQNGVLTVAEPDLDAGQTGIFDGIAGRYKNPITGQTAPGLVADTANQIITREGSDALPLLVNLPQTLSSGRGGGISFLLGKVGSHLIQLELSAMQQEGQGEIISNPRVITADQSKAVIKQGVEIPYQEASASGATSVSFKEAVLQLEVTPQITPDDRVIMDLKVNKDNPDFTRSVLGVPPVDTREVETTVVVDNGETVVLGGVFERTRSENIERIPFFGELPYVGFFFRQRQEQDENNELMIFVTPRILKETLTLR